MSIRQKGLGRGGGAQEGVIVVSVYFSQSSDIYAIVVFIHMYSH